MMSLKIFSEKNLPLDKWINLTDNSLYSSPQFVLVWKTMYKREIFMVLENEGIFKAGIAGMVYGNKFLRRFQSMPDGLAGGPFFDNSLSNEEREQFVDYLAKWFQSMNVIRADINEPQADLNSKYFTRRETYTHIVSLGNDSLEKLNPKIKEHIRTGAKRGTVIEILNDSKYIDDFYELVIVSEKRHGVKPRYSKQFFIELFNRFKEDKRVLWLMARAGDKMIGSRICFINNDQISLWQYYSDNEYNSFKPGELLIHHIFKYAMEIGLKYINLGWSPPGAGSLVAYKEKWGGVKTVFPYYTFFNRVGKLFYGWREK
jgi:lipid II:glycine glycyltransferase (peptidoglycan interpeptide bridge formation enzyme)